MLTDGPRRDATLPRCATSAASPRRCHRRPPAASWTASATVVLNSYGQAEVGEVVGWTAADAREHPEKLGAAGRPHKGVDIRVVDDDGARGRARCRRRAPGAPAPHGRRATPAARRSPTASTRRASSAPGITPASTPTASSGSRAAPRTSSTVAATRSSPSRSRRCCAWSPASTTWRSSRRLDERLGEVPVAVVVGAASDEDLEAACRAELAPYKVPVAFTARRVAAPQRDRQAPAQAAGGRRRHAVRLSGRYSSDQLSSRSRRAGWRPMRKGLSGASTSRMRRRSRTAARWRSRQGCPARSAASAAPQLLPARDRPQQERLVVVAQRRLEGPDQPPAVLGVERATRLAGQLHEIGRRTGGDRHLVVGVGDAAGALRTELLDPG